MLKEQWITADARIENPNAEAALQRHESERDRQHGCSEDEDEACGIERPDEERQAKPGHSRRAELVHGDNEIQPGEDRRKAVDENADRHGDDPAVGVGAAVGRVESPARVDSAEENRGHGKKAAEHEDVPANQVQSRECHVACADHHRDEKISQHVGNGRNEKEPNHDHAVQGEELVVGRGGEELAARMDQFKTHEQGRRAPDEEEKRDGSEIEQRYALVIVGEKPRRERLFLVEVVDLGHASNVSGRCHGRGMHRTE